MNVHEVLICTNQMCIFGYQISMYGCVESLSHLSQSRRKHDEQRHGGRWGGGAETNHRVAMRA